MEFKIKTFTELVNNMSSWIITHCSKLTNLYVGSALRSIVESVAIEIESLYFQMQKGFMYAIEHAIYNSFNFFQFPDIASSGEVTLVFNAPLPQRMTIPAGFTVSTVPYNKDAIYFIVENDYICLEGTLTAVVPVRCIQTGIIGNVPAYSIRLSSSPITYISDIYNEFAFVNGSPMESIQDRKNRFNAFINNLSRGTLDSIKYGCTSIEGISGAYLIEETGLVTAYVYDISGNLSDELKTKVENNMINYRSGGIEVIILPPVKVLADIDITVTLSTGDPDAYQLSIQNSVINYLNTFTIAKSLLRADLIRHIMDINKVSILNVSFNLTDDIIAESNEIIRPGTINVIVS